MNCSHDVSQRTKRGATALWPTSGVSSANAFRNSSPTLVDVVLVLLVLVLALVLLLLLPVVVSPTATVVAWMTTPVAAAATKLWPG